MMKKFQNKYRIPSARWKGFDYGQNGAYFITINTKDREHFFGKVSKGIMELSPCGIIASSLWNAIPQQHPYVEVGEYVVMPDHIHGILIVKTRFIASRFIASRFIASPITSQSIEPSGEETRSIEPTKETRSIESTQETRSIESTQETRSIASLPEPPSGGVTTIHNPMLHDNISRIVRWYKGRCSFEIRKINVNFKWQALFHDRVIRNDAEYQRIQQYIINNPSKWHP